MNSENNGMKFKRERESREEEKWREKDFSRHSSSLPRKIVWNVVVGIPIVLCFFFTVAIAGV